MEEQFLLGLLAASLSTTMVFRKSMQDIERVGIAISSVHITFKSPEKFPPGWQGRSSGWQSCSC